MGDGILADGDVDPAGSGHCIFYDLTDVAEKRLDRDPDIAVSTIVFSSDI